MEDKGWRVGVRVVIQETDGLIDGEGKRECGGQWGLGEFELGWSAGIGRVLLSW